MIGPLLRVAANAATARSLRVAADETINGAITRTLLTLGAAAAVGVGAACLSFSAYVVMERPLEPAGAAAVVGGFWALLGLAYFIATRARRQRR